MAGTISTAGQLALSGQSPIDGTQVTIQGTVDAARSSFSGSILFALAGLSVTLPITGAKRSGEPTGGPSTGPIGEVELLSASVPFGEAIPTVRLGSEGQAAPSLTFTFAVRTFESQTGILAQVWVRTDAVRCMGTGIANLEFAAGERRELETLNVSFQQGTESGALQASVRDHVGGDHPLPGGTGAPVAAFPGQLHLPRAMVSRDHWRRSSTRPRR
jgi:hypothetical protein